MGTAPLSRDSRCSERRTALEAPESLAEDTLILHVLVVYRHGASIFLKPGLSFELFYSLSQGMFKNGRQVDAQLLSLRQEVAVDR